MKLLPGHRIARAALGAVLLMVGSGAAGCAGASAADERALGSLSADELLGLCDELRDPVTRFERPLECSDGWTVQLVAPSNASCWLADRTLCDATAGDVRRCAAAVLDDPCGSASEPPDACLRLSDCDASLVASAVFDACPQATFNEFPEGVYAVTTRALSSCEPMGAEQDAAGRAPRPLVGGLASMPSEGLWVVTSGEIASKAVANVQWCDDPDSCRALASGVASPEPSAALTPEPLAVCQYGRGIRNSEARSPRPADPCQIPSTRSTMTETAPGALRLEIITRSAPLPREERGCGFIIDEPALQSPPCETVEVYTASYMLQAPDVDESLTNQAWDMDESLPQPTGP